jgi:hypothetical protein
MAVPFVGKPDPMAKAVEQRVRLEMRNVDDEGPTRLEYPGHVPDEFAVVREVLQEVHDHDLIE